MFHPTRPGFWFLVLMAGLTIGYYLPFLGFLMFIAGIIGFIDTVY